MIDQLSQLKNAKSTKKDYPCLFDSGNIEAMYHLMDPEGRGFITSAQFAEGNSSLCITNNGSTRTEKSSNRTRQWARADFTPAPPSELQ